MGLTIRRSGGIPSRVWDEVAMRQTGLTAGALIQARSFDRGHGLDDRPHKPYSARYRAFRESKGFQVSPPNLTRTGRMRRSFRLLYVSPRLARLGLAGAPAVYGHFVHQFRPWLGLSQADKGKLRDALPGIVRAAIARSVARRGR